MEMERKQSIKLFFVVFSCIIMSVCTETGEKLDGVWFTEIEKIKSSQQDLGIIFKNDTIYLINEVGHSVLGKFHVIKDTIVFQDYKKQVQKYLIKRHTADSLILSMNGKDKVFHNQILEFNYNLKFNKITLIIGKETKPEFIMALDNMGNVITKKRVDKNNFTEKYLKLTINELNTVDSLFKYSCIDKADTTNWWLTSDGWPKSMKFEYNGKEKTIRTLDMAMPYRIQPIFYNMINIAVNRKHYP